MYRAKQDVQLPKVKSIPLIGLNQTPEERNIVKDKLYIYDKKEDRNYPVEITNNQIPITKQILNSNNQNSNESGTWNLDLGALISWYSDSKHLAVNEGNRIVFLDYDGSNKETLYSGPFDKEFMKITSDGKILILTNFNLESNKYPDLYSVGIR